MMWQPDDDDPFFPPAPKKRIKGIGKYPPDVERLRRRYGLPVTPEEFRDYEAERAWPKVILLSPFSIPPNNKRD